jgi:hypothetical protein
LEKDAIEQLPVRELFDYHRRLSRLNDRFQRLRTLWVAALLKERLQGCCDNEICNLVSEIQAELSIFGPEFAVFEQAKLRLQRGLAAPTTDIAVNKDPGRSLHLVKPGHKRI